MTLTTDLIGLVLLAMGAAIIFAVKRAKFQRTNKYGVERFATFGAELQARFGSHIAIAASIALLSAGLITLASHHMDNWGGVIIAPVSAIMLYLLLGTT